MEIVFSLTEEDILDLAKFRNEKVPLLQKRVRRVRVREVYRDEKYRAALAPRTWRIGADGLEESSAIGEIKVKWDNIDQVFFTATGAFISVMHMPEMVIPKERVVQGDYEGFVAALQARIQGEQG